MVGKIMYIPFANDWKLLSMANDVLINHNLNPNFSKFEKNVYYPNDENNALERVKPTHQLYIAAHGNIGGAFIGDNQGNRLSMHDLARQLAKQKLTRKIKKIKLFACNSGTETSNIKSTAYQLYVALSVMGFDKVTVYGYQGILNTLKQILTEDLIDLPMMHRVAYKRI